MKKVSGLLKIGGAVLLGSLVLLLYLLPVQAIGGIDIQLSLEGAGGPDMDINGNGTYVAVVYYVQGSASGQNEVYLKSANGTEGWGSARFLGFGTNPQVAFKQPVANSNEVYVVWVNANVTTTVIQAAHCILNLTTAPTCDSPGIVRELPAGSLNLAEPDIVVDSSNVLHVAWQNAGVIETKLSSDVTSWPANPATPGLCGGSKASEPVLGWTSSSNKVHLAFLCGTSATAPTSVEYRRSGASSHVWNEGLRSFKIGSDLGDINPANTQLDGLALHANGSRVSLTWDGRLGSSSQEFSLMYAASTDEGVNWTPPSYVPSGTSASSLPSGENKLSSSPSLPVQEFGLRPSLVISGTAGNAAVVWQQKLNGDCQEVSSRSSDIHYADPQNSSASLDTLEHSSVIADYSIDPDLVVGPGGVRHFVFMKDNNASSCVGGNESAYAIYYRGPIIKTISGHLQPVGGGGVYLPLVIR